MIMKNITPASFFNLSIIPHIFIDARYASSDNFTGQKLPGYGTIKTLWLHEKGKQSLLNLSQKLKERKLGLWVWDAYRPKQATDAMVTWAQQTQQYHLVTEGYIAIRSRHNGGGALDCSLYDLTTGLLLDMGTEWDTFEEESHVKNAFGPARDNRLILHEYMNDAGWSSYEKEWWHFELEEASQLEPLDIPYLEDL
jgi:zinc D-Ala-D-Ala dipeptidase